MSVRPFRVGLIADTHGLLRPEVIDLTAQLEGMRLLLDRSLGEDISVVVDLPAGLWRVLVDPSEFELAIRNLAVNARDAMPGAITIGGENRPAGSDAAAAEEGLTLLTKPYGIAALAAARPN